MRKAIVGGIILGLMIILISSCGKLDENTVAKIGSEEITVDDFNTKLQSLRMPRFSTAEEELTYKKEQLDKMIEDKLYVLAAYEEDFDKDSSIISQLSNLEERLMLRALFNEAIVKNVTVTDEELKTFYDEMATEVKASHILVESEELANDLHKQLTEDNADFGELAKEYSKDPRSGARGGDLGYFTKADMVPEFSEATYNLDVGEISKPVQTSYGWHLIKLMDKRAKQQKPFDEEKDILKKQLENKKQRELSTQFLEDLYKENEVQLAPAGVEVLINKGEGEEQTLLSDEDREKTLVTFKDGMWTVGEFEAEIKKFSGKVPVFENEDQILNQIKRLLQPQLLNNKAKTMNIPETESYQELYKEALDAEMVRIYKQDGIQGQIEVSEEDMQKYYEEHPEEFQDQPMVNVREIQVETEEEAKDLLGKVNAGADFAELAKEKTTRVYTKRKGGELGFFPRKRYPELFDAAWEMEAEAVAGPIPMKNKFSIIKMIEKKEARLKPFNEVQRQIESKLKQEMMKTNKDNWLMEAKKKFKVKINEDAIAATVDEAKYTKPAEKPQASPQAMPQGTKPEIKVKSAEEIEKAKQQGE